jgi:XTP/dITP diphosphohydrolase
MQRRVLVIASANRHKIEEIAAMLPSGFDLKRRDEFGISEEIDESAETIRENSLLKARYVKHKLEQQGLSHDVIADDSGLEVNALGGAPGVHSAIYAGLTRSDEANNKKLLAALSSLSDRHARFATVITLIIKGEVHYFEGEIQGTVAYEPRGDQGFGYDPVFIPAGSRSTFAQMTAEEKNRISHRAQAIAGLIRFLHLQGEI